MSKFTEERDYLPAYTRVEARICSSKKKGNGGRELWVPYIDEFGTGKVPLKGEKTRKQQGKFAEPRPAINPEIEGFHDWPSQSFGVVAFDAFRVTSVGKTPSHIHDVVVQYFPTNRVKGKVNDHKVIFTAGTSFGDYPPAIKKGTRARSPDYGGGEAAFRRRLLKKETIFETGLYPNCIKLRGQTPVVTTGSKFDPCKLNENYAQCLRIKIPEGTDNLYFEIACGDTRLEKNLSLEEQTDRHGFVGVRGCAKLHVMESSSRRYVLLNENVPPSGVLAGYLGGMRGGEELIVFSTLHETYVMGYRVIRLEDQPRTPAGGRDRSVQREDRKKKIIPYCCV